jgi:hypothetical protein
LVGRGGGFAGAAVLAVEADAEAEALVVVGGSGIAVGSLVTGGTAASVAGTDGIATGMDGALCATVAFRFGMPCMTPRTTAATRTVNANATPATSKRTGNPRGGRGRSPPVGVQVCCVAATGFIALPAMGPNTGADGCATRALSLTLARGPRGRKRVMARSTSFAARPVPNGTRA